MLLIIMNFSKLYKIIVILCLFFFSINISAQGEDYHDWKFNFDKGVELFKIDSFKSSIPFLQKSYEIAFQNKIDTLQIKSLIQLGDTYKSIEDYNSAEKKLKEALLIIDGEKGKINELYSSTLLKLSIVYKNKGEYDNAIETNVESNQIIAKTNGIKSIKYVNNLSSLSQAYVEAGKYDDAIAIQKDVLKYFENEDNTSNEFAYANFTMSYLSHYINEYEDEIKYMNKAIEIYGSSHDHYPTFVGNIGLAYQYLGKYEKALTYLSDAVNFSTNKTNKSYAIKLEKLAFAYVSLGEFKKAESMYNNVLGIWDAHLDKNHEDYGQLLNNIGKLNRQIGNYEKAKVLFKQALDNFLLNYDQTHSRYGYLLNDYASMLLKLGQKEEAIELMNSNLQIAIDNNNTNSEDFYNRQFNLAKAYNSIDKYSKALPLLENSANNISIILGKNHQKYGLMLKSLSDTYFGLGNNEKALSNLEYSNKVIISQIDDVFKFRSEKEKRSFLKMLALNFDDMQSLPIIRKTNYDRLNSINLNNQMMLKGLLLNNSKSVLSQLANINDSVVESQLIDYKASKRLLARVLTQPVVDREINIDSLKNSVNLQEVKLVKSYNNYFEDKTSLVKDWNQSKTALNANEVAIEFSHFRLIDKSKQKDSIMYMAYVYKYNSEYPKMIPLFEERKLKSILEKYQSENELYQSQDLYNLIWEPLKQEIEDNNTIYYSPSGMLNQLSFAALFNGNDVLINNHELVQLSSTSILASKQNEPEISSALFVGGVNYEYDVGSDDEQLITDNNNYNYLESESLSKSRGTKSRGESWTYLPGTLTETENIKSLFEAQGNSVAMLSKDKATETNLKNLSGNSPNILHIATHGFFYENLNRDIQFETNLSTEDQYRLAENPLLRSGLIMAGANYAWKHGSNPNEEDDGILSAMEISNLDLSNTNMVVLSACETGLGDIDGSEGVYGLQRAFKMAGVDIIVMSLWQVPDAETSEFMNVFYGNWLSGQKVKTAFNYAQRAMHKKYKNEPLKWAAFVLFE